jgi:RNA polymerase sigma factor (sigma-70 family)
MLALSIQERSMGEARSLAAGNASGVRSDEAAVQEIVRRYGRLIRHAIRRAGGPEVTTLADDIEQTVIVNLWRQMAREQTIDHPASYIYRAAIRETVRAVRRERERAEAAADATPGAVAHSADPEAMAVARQRREALAAAIAALAPDRARAVRAHLGGWSAQEIMELTGWSYQRTRNLVARGMADLRSALVAKGVR